MPIRIPKAHQQPLMKLAEMPVHERRRLVEALASAPRLFTRDAFVHHLTSSTALDQDLIRSIVPVLLSMYRAADSPRDDFVASVIEALDELYANRPSVDKAGWKAVHSDLLQLLSLDDTLGVAAKASDLRSEFGHVYCSARILTDLRPIFGSDPSEPPPAAAIVHTLRLTYHEADNHRHFFVAMDQNDLRGLRRLIERALAKSASLRKEIDRTGIVAVGDEGVSE